MTTMTETPARLDLLDRQKFVDRLLTIAEALSDNRKNACYAVNGDWGVGKSFVLDMFEEQAKRIGVEGQELSRYLIFRYNCWEYDYYDEPLIAIVASMLDQIEENVDLLPEELKERVIAVLKLAGKGLFKKAIDVVADKTGIDLGETIDILKAGGEAAERKIKESHNYDHYFSFKKTLRELKKTIADLSANQTVILIVDELDRCLPEYTIKVLERLHHLFEGLDNVQVILSIDIGQLEHVVHQIYGEQTDAKKYLRKFIQFELGLNEGIIKDHFEERFNRYTHFFELKSPTTKQDDVAEFQRIIFSGQDMRNRISIINRCELIHSFLIEEGTVDFSYMCMELLLVVLKDYGIDVEYVKSNFSMSDIFGSFRLNGERNQKTMPNGLRVLSDKYSHNHVSEESSQRLYYRDTNNYIIKTYLHAGCLIGRLLCAYRAILSFDNDEYQYSVDSKDLKAFIEYCKEFWTYLQIVH